MAHADPSPVPPAPETNPSEVVPPAEASGRPDASTPTRADSPNPTANPPKAVLLGATVLLSGFVLFQAPTLWSEWQALQRDWESTRRNSPVGYIGISPNPSYALAPDPWAVQRGDAVLLWSGWKDGFGHSWFRIEPGDLDLSMLAKPIGRDVVRAIDHPLDEVGGGTFWERLQHDTPVVGVKVGATNTAYPMLLLAKVEVVNDTIEGRPIMVVSTPFQTPEETVDLYDPTLDGRRLRFGSSGHFVHPVERHPLLYDRETESLWMIRDHQLTCIAGTYKGVRLRHLGRGRPVEWGDWIHENPDGRLIVGADRNLPLNPPLLTGLPSS